MSWLHYIGEFFRSMMLGVPLEVARGIFVLVMVGLLIWVLVLPQAQVTPPGRPVRPGENLKVWAALALVLQVLIYIFL
jgi:hypothetical protein